MKYILFPLFIFSICLLVYVGWLVNGAHHDGALILVPFIFIGSLCGFTAHHLIYGLNVRYITAILLELIMILLIILAGFLLGIVH